MIKFKNKLDEDIFRSEFLKSGMSLDEFLVERGKLEVGLVDFERSQRQKQNWRKHRWKYLKGIRRFHSSTEGKRFHRNLARYLATRDSDSLLKLYQAEKEKERERGNDHRLDVRKVSENLEFLIAALSAGVHGLIEKRYYNVSIDEAVEYDLFLEELLRKVVEVIEWVFGIREGVDWDFWIGICKDALSKLGLEVPEGVEKEGEMLEWFTKELKKGVKVEDDDEESSSEGSV
ncbi:MAG: hypothetical protein JHC26_08485 [Thermofilum sp.]|jgi:hypothetical protein|uniref:hypothetical protein n=1 Tax=Thermofilum sp. TaxID=1961369 RepID=UPI002586F8AF|nr:hypothetical protein [Thermofilum sp.]MCI4409113.1 hypothetical protein [Thermofilum sp.]